MWTQNRMLMGLIQKITQFMIAIMLIGFAAWLIPVVRAIEFHEVPTPEIGRTGVTITAALTSWVAYRSILRYWRHEEATPANDFSGGNPFDDYLKEEYKPGGALHDQINTNEDILKKWTGAVPHSWVKQVVKNGMGSVQKQGVQSIRFNRLLSHKDEAPTTHQSPPQSKNLRISTFISLIPSFNRQPTPTLATNIASALQEA